MAVSTQRANRFEFDHRIEVVEAPSPAGLGCWFGLILAGVVGWFSVPNALVADSSLEVHARLTVASMLAVVLWSYNLAQRAIDRPGTAALRLAFGIYAACLLTIPLCRVPLVVGPLSSGLALTSVLGLVLAPAPWILLLAVVWAYGLRFGWPVLTAAYPRSIGGRISLSLAENRRAAGVAGAGLALLLVSSMAGVPDTRHIAWQVPAKPAAHHAASSGVVTLVDGSGANGDVVVSLEDGRTYRLPASAALSSRSIQQGDFLVFAGDPAAWWDAVPGSFHGGDALGSSFAWDTGDGILFPDGLELSKASDLATNGIAPTRAFGEKVYALGRCAEIRVNAAAEVAWLGSVCR